MANGPSRWVLTTETKNGLLRMLAEWRAGRLGGGRGPIRGGAGMSGRLRMAKVVTATIAAGDEGNAQPQMPDWTDTGSPTVKVTNDHLVDLPVGTKLYIEDVQGKWRVIVPFVECE